MSIRKFKELFTRYKQNPILTVDDLLYEAASVFNPGAVKFNNQILLLLRVEDKQGYSHLTVAKSEDGKTNWQIDFGPALAAEPDFGEDVFGLEDPRVVWIEERQEYIITCVFFLKGVAGEPPGISLIATKDFLDFKRLGRLPIIPNKNASLFPKTFNDYYAVIHRPIIEGSADIWVSFSKDLESWGRDRVLIPARSRTWDSDRIGLGPPPIETPDGWLIIYHGARDTASGTIYRIGLALLDLETLEVIRRSRDWVFGPKKYYEMVGDVNNIVFPCGAIVDEKTNELSVYYGAADSVVALATADLNDLLEYLKKCEDY